MARTVHRDALFFGVRLRAAYCYSSRIELLKVKRGSLRRIRWASFVASADADFREARVRVSRQPVYLARQSRLGTNNSRLLNASSPKRDCTSKSVERRARVAGIG